MKPSKVATSTGVSALQIIAQPNSTLELYSVSNSVVSFLEGILEVYNGPLDADGDLELSNASRLGKENRSRRNLIEDLPASIEECEQGLLEICAFEHANALYRPSERALCAIWQAIHCVAASEEIDLCSHFDIDALLRLLEDDMWPKGAIEAVVTRSALEIGGNPRSIKKRTCGL